MIPCIFKFALFSLGEVALNRRVKVEDGLEVSFSPSFFNRGSDLPKFNAPRERLSFLHAGTPQVA
jgi:hypothetical protein